MSEFSVESAWLALAHPWQLDAFAKSLSASCFALAALSRIPFTSRAYRQRRWGMLHPVSEPCCASFDACTRRVAAFSFLAHGESSRMLFDVLTRSPDVAVVSVDRSTHGSQATVSVYTPSLARLDSTHTNASHPVLAHVEGMYYQLHPAGRPPATRALSPLPMSSADPFNADPLIVDFSQTHPFPTPLTLVDLPALSARLEVLPDGQADELVQSWMTRFAAYPSSSRPAVLRSLLKSPETLNCAAMSVSALALVLYVRRHAPGAIASFAPIPDAGAYSAWRAALTEFFPAGIPSSQLLVDFVTNLPPAPARDLVAAAYDVLAYY